jgi:hypothetical protein
MKILAGLILTLVLASCTMPDSSLSHPRRGVMVAVGAGGSIARSLDHGETWQVSMGNQIKIFNGGRTDLTVDGNLIVNGELNKGRFAQIDALASSLSQINTTGFPGDVYVRGHVYQSLGEAWSGLIANSFAGRDIRGIAFGNGVFVAVTVGGGKIARSTDFGATWSGLIANSFGGAGIFSIAYGNGVFVATASLGEICRSTDYGVTWSALIANPFGGGEQIYSIAYGDGVFVAVSDGGNISRSLDLGVTWSAFIVNPFGGSIIHNCSFGSGVFVVVADGGKIARSTDLGLTWGSLIANPFGGATNILGMAFGNGVFVAGSQSATIARSVDLGVTWGSLITNPLGGQQIYSMSYNFGIFQAGAGTGATARSYDNGLTWGGLVTNPFGANAIYSIASSPQTTPGTGNIVAVGVAGSIATAGWNEISDSIAAPLPQTAAGVGQYVTYLSVASVTLNAGGTWISFIQRFSAVTGVSSGQYGGFDAGGNTIGAAAANQVWNGWAWRIA